MRLGKSCFIALGTLLLALSKAWSGDFWLMDEVYPGDIRRAAEAMEQEWARREALERVWFCHNAASPESGAFGATEAMARERAVFTTRVNACVRETLNRFNPQAIAIHFLDQKSSIDQVWDFLATRHERDNHIRDLRQACQTSVSAERSRRAIRAASGQLDCRLTQTWLPPEEKVVERR